jgi:cobalamin-dependent methionine synthase I
MNGQQNLKRIYDYNSIMVKALADRFEAFAEYLHEK